MNDERLHAARRTHAAAEALRQPQVILGLVLWGATAALLLILSAAG